MIVLPCSRLMILLKRVFLSKFCALWLNHVMDRVFHHLFCVIPQNIHTHPKKGHWTHFMGRMVKKSQILNRKYEGRLQREKKVLSDSLGLVDFTIGLVNSVLNLPNGQVKYFEVLNLQKNCEINSAPQKFWGLVEMTLASKC